MIEFFTTPGKPFNVFPEELESLELFLNSNNIKWDSNDRQLNILSISSSYVGYVHTPIRKIFFPPKYSEISFSHIFRIYLFTHGYQKNDSAFILDFSPELNNNNIVDIFLNSLEEKIPKGLHQQYDYRMENVNYLKGKVSLRPTFSNYLKNKDKYVVARSSYLTTDTTLNRLIYSALIKIEQLKKYHSPAKKLARYFEGVKSIEESGTNALHSIHFNNLNSGFREIATYAAMIIDKLDHSGIGNSLGQDNFILNFDDLFEEFVKKVFAEFSSTKKFYTIKNKNILGHRFRSNGKILMGNLTYLPDIVYEYNVDDPSNFHNPSAVSVIDVKNKAHSIFSNSDIYQISFYQQILNSSSQLLVYPGFYGRNYETIVLPEFTFPINTVFACFINITDKTGEDFINSLANFVWQVENIIESEI